MMRLNLGPNFTETLEESRFMVDSGSVVCRLMSVLILDCVALMGGRQKPKFDFCLETFLARGLKASFLRTVIGAYLLKSFTEDFSRECSTLGFKELLLLSCLVLLTMLGFKVIGSWNRWLTPFNRDFWAITPLISWLSF